MTVMIILLTITINSNDCLSLYFVYVSATEFSLIRVSIIYMHCSSLALTNGNANGYLPSVGSGKAREAIALFSSRPGYIIDADDVIICSGCSGAIDLILQGMLNEGTIRIHCAHQTP